MDYKANYENWLNDNYFDDLTRAELLALADDAIEIEDRFHKNLDFGTGGLRGIIAAGTNRMNIYTVRKATQGLANYIIKNTPDGKCRGVAIAYSSRRYSKEFAEAAALTLCASGIKVYIFGDLRPTPVLSFTVRHLGCVSGIVITASHNPPEYNGYKCYWEDGAQVKYPQDVEIINEVNAVKSFSEISTMSKEDAVNVGLLNYIGKEVDDAFIAAVLEQGVHKDAAANAALSIVFTPLNGAGNVLVRRALSEAGFVNIYVPPEQENPDPNFTTIGYPNPENRAAFDIAIK
ncbi:MAG: phospho-sugar mutase, partial [Defluviitaleaceae bacterium]|nr:phospho-sugar mutase [Defluviitaleaceae bacterium]